MSVLLFSLNTCIYLLLDLSKHTTCVCSLLTNQNNTVCRRGSLCGLRDFSPQGKHSVIAQPRLQVNGGHGDRLFGATCQGRSYCKTCFCWVKVARTELHGVCLAKWMLVAVRCLSTYIQASLKTHLIQELPPTIHVTVSRTEVEGGV